MQSQDRLSWAVANNLSGRGIFFSTPWKERPWWSKAKDITSIGLSVIVLLIVLWETARRWLGN
jgi:hypothetical protein